MEAIQGFFSSLTIYSGFPHNAVVLMFAVFFPAMTFVFCLSKFFLRFPFLLTFARLQLLTVLLTIMSLGSFGLAFSPIADRLVYKDLPASRLLTSAYKEMFRKEYQLCKASLEIKKSNDFEMCRTTFRDQMEQVTAIEKEILSARRIAPEILSSKLENIAK